MNARPGTLLGHTVALTGKCLNRLRQHVEEAIRTAGGVSVSAVDRNTAVLVAKDWPRNFQTEKIKAAIRFNVPIINDTVFGQVLQGTLSLQQAIATRPGFPGDATSPPPSAPPPTPPVRRVDLSVAFQDDGTASPFRVSF